MWATVQQCRAPAQRAERTGRDQTAPSTDCSHWCGSHFVRVVQTLDTPSRLPPSNDFVCSNCKLISPKWTHRPYHNSTFTETFVIWMKYGLHSRYSNEADLGGLVFMRGALWLFGPLSLQVRTNDGIKGHCPPHARAQLVNSGLSCCQIETFFLFDMQRHNQISQLAEFT